METPTGHRSKVNILLCVHPSCLHDHGFCVKIVVIEALLGFTGGTKRAGSRNNGCSYCSCWGRARPAGWWPLIGRASRTRETPSGCGGG